MSSPFLTLPPGAAARPNIIGVASPVALRAVLPSSLFVVGMGAQIVGSNPFVWDPASVAPDDGVSVICPNDITPPAPGRWLVSSGATPPAGSGALHYPLTGVYSGAVVPGFYAPPDIADAAFTLDHVQLVRRTAGSAGSTDIDVLKNGTSILAAPLSIAFGAGDNASATTNTWAAPGANTFAPGDVIDVHLLAVETFLPGPPSGPEGLRVVLVKV